MSGPVTTRRGPRETERALIAWIDRERTSSPDALRRVLVVVPSESLRGHLLRRIAGELGPAVVGVEVRSLFGIAATILARAGQRMPRGAELHGILARRAVAEQPALSEALDAFEDGAGLAVSAIKDLTSAGLDRSNLERVLGLLKPLGGRAEGRRAIALARAAVATARAMKRHECGMASDLFHAAGREFDEHGDSILHAEAVAIHGFVDATGRGRMLLSRIAEARNVHVFFDAGAAAGPAPALLEDFARRLGVEVSPAPGSETESRVRLFRASGTQAEVAEAAWRIREAIAAGTAPEKIAVVMRSPEPYALALRQTFRELGVPFSGGETPPGVDPRARSGRALAELLELRGEMAADHWMDTWGCGELEGGRIGPLQRADVLLALRAMGAARLRNVADLDVDAVLKGHDEYPLPVRRGTRTLEARDGEVRGEVVVTRRKLRREHLERVVSLARATRRAVDGWPTEGALGDHLEAVRHLTDDVLGWRDRDTPWRHALRSLDETPLPGLALSRSEFLVLLRPFLSETAAARLGGAGGGVQVMPLARARGLTFERVFLLGLNRGVVPSSGAEDTLLGDDVRIALRPALPDLGLAATRIEEERHVFDQILGCAPEVDLSWQRADDEGRELSPSPFIEALRLARPELVYDTVPALEEERLETPSWAAVPRPLPARLALRRAALRRDRAGWRAVAAATGDRDRANARAQVLAEVDPDRRDRDGDAAWRRPGPWYGFVGPISPENDARARRLFITTLEGFAWCPWRNLLGGVLKLEPNPDPLDALPDVDNLLLGRTVHTALELLVKETGARAGGTLAEAVSAGPVTVPRPDDAAIAVAARRAAVQEAFETGVVQGGFARALGRRAAPLIRTAVELDWGDGAVDVLGAELQGEVVIGERTVAFRADRVDRGADGRPVLSDYKSGGAVSTSVARDDAKRAAKQREHLLAAVAAGTKLQSTAYARGADGAIGRYLALKPDIPDVTRISVADSGDVEIVAAFEEAAARFLRAWDEGIFFPRLEDGAENEPKTCKEWCELKAACVRGDSAHRRRLRELAEGVHEEGTPERLLADLWRTEDDG